MTDIENREGDKRQGRQEKERCLADTFKGCACCIAEGGKAPATGDDVTVGTNTTLFRLL